MHVYSDVAGSTIVGNRVTDLLREIQYKRQGRGTMYFEPLHIQYLPLRNEVVEIIHVQVAETRLVPEETWSSLVTAIPLSRCTSKKDKKGDFTELLLIMSVKKRRTTKRRTKGPKKRTTKRSTVRRGRRQHPQRVPVPDFVVDDQVGEGIASVIAGLPKAAWSITKGLEKLAKKNARKSHLKRMEEIRSGKRKRYAGESFTCNIM